MNPYIKAIDVIKRKQSTLEQVRANYQTQRTLSENWTARRTFTDKILALTEEIELLEQEADKLLDHALFMRKAG